MKNLATIDENPNPWPPPAEPDKLEDLEYGDEPTDNKPTDDDEDEVEE